MPVGVNNDGYELSLAEGWLRSGLSWNDLWLRYIGVGGRGGELEMAAYVTAALAAPTYEHDLIAYALNEYLHEYEPTRGYPVVYWFTAPTDQQH